MARSEAATRTTRPAAIVRSAWRREEGYTVIGCFWAIILTERVLGGRNDSSSKSGDRRAGWRCDGCAERLRRRGCGSPGGGRGRHRGHGLESGYRNYGTPQRDPGLEDF